MGLERTIRFATAETPSWPAIREALARVGEVAPIRMIDGLPAFPDETPDPTWKELRLGCEGGMITIRRGPGLLSCVVWGNAGEQLSASWGKVVLACARAGGGTIELPSGQVGAEEFARSLGLQPA